MSLPMRGWLGGQGSPVTCHYSFVFTNSCQEIFLSQPVYEMQCAINMTVTCNLVRLARCCRCPPGPVCRQRHGPRAAVCSPRSGWGRDRTPARSASFCRGCWPSCSRGCRRPACSGSGWCPETLEIYIGHFKTCNTTIVNNFTLRISSAFVAFSWLWSWTWWSCRTNPEK